MTLVADARQWLAAHWDAETKSPVSGDRQGWLQKVFEAGWAVPTWPEEWWGRGADAATAQAISAEFRKVGAPGTGQDRTSIPGVTLYSFADKALAKALVPEFLTHRKRYCLLYSEPGAGSDLASLRTRAERHGDDWRINGQKIWTSGADTADYGLLLARTNWDVPKHQGISFFIIDMRQPGITIRPINQINGESHFFEVFIDDATVPASHLLGREGEGWKVLQTALGVERLLMGEGGAERKRGSARDELLTLVRFARDTGRLHDPVIRQDIARATAWRHLNELNRNRAREESAGTGAASPLMSMAKLAMSKVLHEEARVMGRSLGMAGLLDGDAHPLAADANFRAAHAYMTSIGGGTDQIQRNIIAERVLGLPRELEPDRDLPFRNSLAMKG